MNYVQAAQYARDNKVSAENIALSYGGSKEMKHAVDLCYGASEIMNTEAQKNQKSGEVIYKMLDEASKGKSFTDIVDVGLQEGLYMKDIQKMMSTPEAKVAVAAIYQETRNEQIRESINAALKSKMTPQQIAQEAIRLGIKQSEIVGAFDAKMDLSEADKKVINDAYMQGLRKEAVHLLTSGEYTLSETSAILQARGITLKDLTEAFPKIGEADMKKIVEDISVDDVMKANEMALAKFKENLDNTAKTNREIDKRNAERQASIDQNKSRAAAGQSTMTIGGIEVIINPDGSFIIPPKAGEEPVTGVMKSESGSVKFVINDANQTTYDLNGLRSGMKESGTEMTYDLYLPGGGKLQIDATKDLNHGVDYYVNMGGLLHEGLSASEKLQTLKEGTKEYKEAQATIKKVFGEASSYVEKVKGSGKFTTQQGALAEYLLAVTGGATGLYIDVNEWTAGCSNSQDFKYIPAPKMEEKIAVVADRTELEKTGFMKSVHVPEKKKVPTKTVTNKREP